MRLAATCSLAVGMVVAGGIATGAQTAVPAPVSAEAAASQATTPSQAVTGGKLHGVAKSGNTPLPGVTVTAQNTLTGKRYSTTTDITGGWSLTIPQNGRYVIRTQFAAFVTGSQEALLNASNHEQTVNFDLMLASRAAAQQQAQQGSQSGAESQGAQAIRQLIGSGAQSLSL